MIRKNGGRAVAVADGGAYAPQKNELPRTKVRRILSIKKGAK